MEKEKYVDESWKEAAALEKQKLDENFKHEKNSPTAHVKQEESSRAKTPQTQHDRQDDFESEGQEASGNPSSGEDQAGEAEVNFLNYITSLGYQAMIFLGVVPHPMTQQIETNLQQAKFLIDTLVMLRDKTKGNLTKQEENMLHASIYELQTKYVESLKQEEGKMTDRELLDILACPACRGEVEEQDKKIVCRSCGRKYPIKDGIPIMLVDEAEK